MKECISLIGQTFGELTVLECVGKLHPLHYGWKCKCLCGNEVIIRGYNLKNGKSKHCGCKTNKNRSLARFKYLNTTPNEKRIRNKRATKVIRGYKSEYKAWTAMRQRCNYVGHKQYSDYGGRGIQVCVRWEEFNTFLVDMGPKPSPNHSLDRIDNNGNYEPTNCRWATIPQQNRNRRANVYLYLGDERKIIADWARVLNVHVETLKRGLKKEKSLGDIIVERNINYIPLKNDYGITHSFGFIK